MGEAIISTMNCSWQQIATDLVSRQPLLSSVYYLKVMTHHMLDEVDLAFTERFFNCFLVREPGRVIASYARVRPHFDLHDLGFPQQLRIFRHVEQHFGVRPLVLDSARVLADPRAELSRLCNGASIGFSEKMLSWPPGSRPAMSVGKRPSASQITKTTGHSSPFAWCTVLRVTLSHSGGPTGAFSPSSPPTMTTSARNARASPV